MEQKLTAPMTETRRTQRAYPHTACLSCPSQLRQFPLQAGHGPVLEEGAWVLLGSHLLP